MLKREGVEGDGGDGDDAGGGGDADESEEWMVLWGDDDDGGAAIPPSFLPSSSPTRIRNSAEEDEEARVIPREFIQCAPPSLCIHNYTVHLSVSFNFLSIPPAFNKYITHNTTLVRLVSRLWWVGSRLQSSSIDLYSHFTKLLLLTLQQQMLLLWHCPLGGGSFSF